MINKKAQGEAGLEGSGFIDAFPSLAITKERTIAICEKPRTNPSDLNGLIHVDPILFAKTQHIFKSFFPRHKEEYVSVAKIITVLHINTIRSYVKQAALRACEVKTGSERDAESVFSRIIARAYAARFLAESAGVPEEKLQQYYAAGLLYDFAALAAPQGKRASAAEVARLWGLGGALADVVSFKSAYKTYDGKRKHLLWTSAVADYCAAKICGEKGLKALLPPSKVFGYLNLPVNCADMAAPAVKKELGVQLAFLKGGR